MLSFIVVFGLVSFSSIYTFPQPLQSDGIGEVSLLISSENCNFYTALNTQFQCDPKSHLLQYSFKYCQKLVDARASFQNTQYQDDVRQCLQQKLYAKIQQAAEGTITCDSFKQMDLDSHESCFAVGFKQLSANDVTQFIATFKDTTVNYVQLCKMAQNFAGHWSQIVNGDLMQFVKQQLTAVFPEGDTTTCTIKENEIIEEIIEVVTDIEKILDQVKGIKDDIVLIIEKAKAIRDDFKTIQETIKGMKDGSISELDGMKIILEKTQTIMANSKTIIDTIKNIVEGNKNQPTVGGEENANVTRILQDMIDIITQVEALKGEVYKIVDNVASIIDTVNDIRDGKTNIIDGLVAIGGQLENGVDNIFSVISTSYSLENSVVDLVDTVVKDIEGTVENLIDTGKETVDGVIDGANGAIGTITDNIGGGIGGITGGLGGFGK